MANTIFSALPTTIFEEMSGLARTLGAVNLGQGFPDDPGPEAVRVKAGELVVSGYNQYPPMAGLPELRQAVAAHYARTQGWTSIGRPRSRSPRAPPRPWPPVSSR